MQTNKNLLFTRHCTTSILQDISSTRWDSIIIGSGMGGLTAASVLCQAGEQVLLLEKHTTLGGCTHVFTRPEPLSKTSTEQPPSTIEFDTGVHYMGGKVWESDSFAHHMFNYITNSKMKWKRLDPIYDVAVVDGRKYSFPSGLQQQCQYMIQEFPQDKLGIEKYYQDIQLTAEKASKYLSDRIAEAYLNRTIVQLFEDTTWGAETVDEALNRLQIHNLELRNALTYLHGDYGAMPHEASWAQHALTVYHYVYGAAYPVGGPSTIADAVATVLETKNKSRVLTHAGVSEFVLNIAGEVIGVKLQHDTSIVIKARKIISCVGAHTTFNMFFPKTCTLPAVIEARKDLLTMALSPSHVMVFLVLDGSSKDLQLPAQNWWINCTTNNSGNTEFESVFISFPSAKDPDTWEKTHPNLSICELVVESKYAMWEGAWSTQNVKNRDDQYKDAKDKCAQLAVEVLKKHFPQLQHPGKIKYMEASTPLSSEHYLNSTQGCAYGLRAIPKRYELNRKWLSPCSNVRNLYLGGQDVCSCGVVGAMCGGMMAAAAANFYAMVNVRQLAVGGIGGDKSNGNNQSGEDEDDDDWEGV
jgi:all-trans-retinol 13,14-reductase